MGNSYHRHGDWGKLGGTDDSSVILDCVPGHPGLNKGNFVWKQGLGLHRGQKRKLSPGPHIFLYLLETSPLHHPLLYLQSLPIY